MSARIVSAVMRKPVVRAAALAVLGSIAAAAAFGDGRSPGRDERRAASPEPAAYRQECGACHVAYPARLLPAESWRRLMDHLPQHFGTDASVDDATRAAIAQWLAGNAGTGRRGREAPPEDRITRSAWFVHEHDEVPAGTWKRASIKGPSNCSACHRQAEQGDFDEHRIRIPG